jgi:hypothetical protein
VKERGIYIWNMQKGKRNKGEGGRAAKKSCDKFEER